MKRITIITLVLLAANFAIASISAHQPFFASTEIPSLAKQDTTTKKVDEFKRIDVNQLNENVQSAIKKLAESYQIDEVWYNEARQITKVVISSNADKSKMEVILDNEGKKVE